MCLNAQNLCIWIFSVCMSSCNMHLLYAYLCEGQNVTREAATVRCKDAYSGKIAKDKILSHIHTLYLWKTRQLVKRRSTKRQRRLQCQLFTNLSLSQPRRSSWSFWATFSSSDSMAARLSISWSCTYNERTARYLVQMIICARFSCRTALKISGHKLLPCIAVGPLSTFLASPIQQFVAIMAIMLKQRLCHCKL